MYALTDTRQSWATRCLASLARLTPPPLIVASAAFAAYSAAPFVASQFQEQAAPNFAISAAPTPSLAPAHVAPRETAPRPVTRAVPFGASENIAPDVVAGAVLTTLALRPDGVSIVRERSPVRPLRPNREFPRRGFGAQVDRGRIGPREILPYRGGPGGQRFLPLGGPRFGRLLGMSGFFRGFHHF